MKKISNKKPTAGKKKQQWDAIHTRPAQAQILKRVRSD